MNRLGIIATALFSLACGASPEPSPVAPLPDLTTVRGRAQACEARALADATDMDAHRCWRQAMIHDGQRAALATALRAARDADPSQSLWWLHEGRAHLTRDPDAAIALYDACLSTAKSPGWCHLGVAEAWLYTDRPQRAIYALPNADLPAVNTAPLAVTLHVARGDLAMADEAAKGLGKDTESRVARARLALAHDDALAANSEIQLIVARRPDDAQLLGLRAEVRAARNLPEAALADLRAAVTIDPADLRIRLQLSRSLISADRNNAALDHLQVLVARRPRALEYRVMLGEAFLATGAFERALAWADDTLAQTPDYGPALALRAQALIRAGKLTEALALRSKLYVGPDAAKRRVALAQALAKMGESRRAESEFAAAVAAHPDEAVAWRAFSEWHRIHRRPARAATILEQGLSRMPDVAALHADMSQIRELVDDKIGARDAMLRAVSLAPDEVDYQDELARIEFVSGDLDGGVRRWTRLAKAHPNAERAMIRLAHAHRAMRDFDEAEQLLRRLVNRRPHDALLKGRLAEVLLMRGNKKASLTFLEAAIAGGADESGRLRALLATALADTGRGDDAREAFEDALRHNSADRALRMTYAHYLGRRGETASAAEMYAAQLARDPEDDEARVRLRLADAGRADQAKLHPWPAATLDPDLAELARTAPAAKGRQAAVVLRDIRRVEIDARGVASVRHQRSILIQRPPAVKLFENASIAFHVAHTPQVIHARTFTPDGQIVDVSEAARTVKDPHEGTPLQGDARALMLRFPALEPGAIIDYEVLTKRPHPELPEIWWDRYILANSEPTQFAEYRLTLPIGGALRVEAPGLGKPDEHEVDGQRTLIWRARDIPGFDLGRAAADVMPAVYVSNLMTWAEVDRWYHGLFSPRARATPEVKAVTQSLVETAQSEPARVAAVYRFVEQEIGYLGLEFGVGAYQPRPVSGTLDQRVGDCKDKTALMVAMLDALGIKAYPALVRPRGHGTFMVQHPSPGQFNHVLLYVPPTRRRPAYWLDPTAGLATLDAIPNILRGQQAFIVNGRGGKLVKVPEASATSQSVTELLDFRINMTGGGEVSNRMELTGDLAGSTRRRLLAVQTSDRKSLLQAPGYLLGAGRIPDSVAVDGLDEPAEPLSLSAKLTDPDLVAVRGDGALMLPLEAILLRSGAWADPTSNARGALQRFERTVRISTPKGYRPKWKRLRYKGKTGPVSMRLNERRTKDAIEIHTRLEFTEARAATQLHLLAAARAASEALVERLIFEPGKALDRVLFYRALVAEQPKNGPLHVLLARVLLEKKRYPEAAEALERARDLNPKDAQVQALLAAALIKAERAEDAVEPLKSLTLRPETPSAVHLMLVTVLAEHDRHDEAIEVLRAARARFPDDRSLGRRLVVAMASTKDFKGALAEATTQAKAHPKDPKAQLLMGDMAAEVGDLPVAEQAYLAGLAISPNNARMLNNLAWALRDVPERRADAIAFVREALRTEPNNDAAWDTLAELLFRAGDRPGALEANAAAIRSAPEKAAFYKARRAQYE